MNYIITITNEEAGTEVVSASVSSESVVGILASLLNGAPAVSAPRLEIPTERPTKQRKWHKANKRGKALQKDIEREHQDAPVRRQHPATAQIEELLIQGLTTPAIMEKVEVSPPTIGVIRARLRKEGRLTV